MLLADVDLAFVFLAYMIPSAFVLGLFRSFISAQPLHQPYHPKPTCSFLTLQRILQDSVASSSLFIWRLFWAQFFVDLSVITALLWLNSRFYLSTFLAGIFNWCLNKICIIWERVPWVWIYKAFYSKEICTSLISIAFSPLMLAFQM